MKFTQILENSGNGSINTIVFCDPGLDDALMLLELLSSEQHVISGIIPGAGNVPLPVTINNTLRICELARRTDIKVFPGCKTPLGQTEDEMIDGTTVYGNDGLGGIQIPPVRQMKVETTDGIDFAVEQIKSKKTLIVSTGGLTDLYKVLQRLKQESPESLANILGISMMAGVINAEQEANAPIGEKRHSEFNILFDTVASKGVFDIANGLIPIYLSPLDLTHSILCSESDIEALKNVQSPVARFAYSLLNAVPDHYKNRFGKGPNNEFRQPLHDVHASACIMHPELYQYARAFVTVDNSTQAGTMHMTPNEEGNVLLLSLQYAYRKAFFTSLINDLRKYLELDISLTDIQRNFTLLANRSNDIVNETQLESTKKFGGEQLKV